MSVFYAYLPLSDCIKQRWRQETPLSHALTLSFEHLISTKDNLMSSSHFNIVRDQMRDYLSNINASYFPRYGTVGAPAELILTYLKEKESPKFCITSPCSSSVSSSTDSVLLSTNDYMPTIFFSSLWTKFCSTTTDNPPPKTASTQDWIDLIFKGKEKERSHSSTSHCLNCSPATPCHTSNIYFDHAPPFLTFEIAPHTIPLHTPSIKLYIKTSPSQPLTEYQFRAVIYHGDYHFTARIIDPHNNIYIYDGQKNEGFPSFESKLIDYKNFKNFTTLHGRSAHIYIYSHLNN